ncbi:MAG: symmetrical bis(5'-nucleosyl)-tetraphosphatase [Aquisalimonadaceae bacterium]
MAVYCIGDIQGCNDELQALLRRLAFNAERDHLWLTGDLVNRGPQSLHVLRFVRSLGERARMVLGNHDIHLLAAWAGAAPLRKNDTLSEILDAPDADALMDWLRRQPLMHEDPALGYSMLHAGLYPFWSLDEARDHAREAESALAGNDHHALFTHMYGSEPSHWSADLQGWERLRFIINAFTRMRYCDAGGRLLLDYKGSPDTRPHGYLPWFQVPGRKPVPPGITLITGHWSTLGFYEQPDLVAIDTGCLWGGELTAIRLDGPRQRTSLACAGEARPELDG